MSYFGYVERAADSYVNWADVGRSLTGTIDAIDQARTEKKALIEKAYREDLDYIMASPSGEQKELGEWSLKFGNTAAENLKLQYNLLKSGKIKVDDFVAFRENLTSDTEKLYSTLSEIQKNFGEAMERYKKGESQVLEQVLMEQIEQYGRLSDTESYVNGLNGHIAIGLTEEVEENGQKVRRLTKDPNKYITIANLKAASLSRYDNYNPEADIQKFADNMGAVEYDLMAIGDKIKAGSITKIVNADGTWLKKQMELAGMKPEEIAVAEETINRFKASRDATFKTMLTPFNQLAILTNQKKFAPNGEQYVPTFNPEDLKKGEQYVLVERDNNGKITPKFTKAQEEDANKFLAEMLDSRLDKKVSKQETSRQPQEQVYRPSPAEIEASGRAKTASATASWIRDLYEGDNIKKETALERLRSYENVEDARFSHKGGKTYIQIETVDGKSTEIPLSGDLSIEQFGGTIADYIDPDFRAIVSENIDQFNRTLRGAKYVEYKPGTWTQTVKPSHEITGQTSKSSAPRKK